MHKESSQVNGQCSVGVVRGAGVAGPRPFKKTELFRKLLHDRTVEYFCMIPFASSRQWSKIILEILSSMLDCPKGRGRATPLFRYKIITGERLNIFA